MGLAEMDQIGELIIRALAHPDDTGALAAVKQDVEALCLKFPLYSERM
jgi:glycine/serine hydroxymethyltransferase